MSEGIMSTTTTTNNVNQPKEAAMVATAEGVKDVCKHKPTTQTTSLTAVLDSAATKHLIKDHALIENMCPLPSPVTLILANKEEEQLTHGGTHQHPNIRSIFHSGTKGYLCTVIQTQSAQHTTTHRRSQCESDDR